MPKMIEDSGVDGPPLVRLAYEIYSDPKEASKLASWLGVLLTDLVDVARKDLTPLKNLMAIAGPYVEDKLRLNVPESKKNEVVDTLP